MDPERIVFDAMQEGWAAQQRSRQLKASTIEGRLASNDQNLWMALGPVT